MKKPITVQYALYDAAEKSFSIPVIYEVEYNGKTEIYKCVINLDPSNIPEWLTVRNFDIPTDQRGKISVTRFSEVKNIKTIDTAFFVMKVYQDISLAESLNQ